MEDDREIIQISPDVSTVTFQGMVCETAKGNHFPEGIEIFVHRKNLL